MRLKSIKLSGFKSFVDPVKIDFPSEMSAVLGPNGCGKSNVIDAVRWVMGESSAKNLRGEAMTDVIFNGSTGRKPVSRASVELFFDNSAKRVTGAFAAFNEISVKRVVTRDGQSIYYLNSSRCRRRDITDLFLGTGLGPRSYAIIEQGMISRIIESKPEEFRVYIEEAAGISKYRERRRETENRMRRTLDNLDRLTDLREELGRQLSSLQRQAKIADRYKRLRAEHRTVDAQHQALVWKGYQETFSQYKETLTALEQSREDALMKRLSAESGVDAERTNREQANDVLGVAQQAFYQKKAEIDQIEKSRALLLERHETLKADVQQVDEELAVVTLQVQEDEATLDELIDKLDDLEPELEAAEIQDEHLTTTLEARESSMGDWQQRWHAFSEKEGVLQRDLHKAQSRIDQGEKSLMRLESRAQTLQVEMAGLQQIVSDENIEQDQKKLGQLSDEREALEIRTADLEEALTTKKSELKQTTKAYHQAKESYITEKGRLESIHQLQAEAFSQNEGIDKWVQTQSLTQTPRLGQEISVEPKWAQAVEIVLNRAMNALCVDDLGEYKDELVSGGVPSGIGLFQAASFSSQSSQSLLADKVKASSPVPHVLTSVICAESVAEALEKREDLDMGQSLITPEGVWVFQDQVLVGPENLDQAGLIEREETRKQLEVSVLEWADKVEALADQQASLDQQIASDEQTLKGLRESLKTAHREHSILETRIAQHLAKQEQIAKREQQVTTELNDIALQITTEQKEVKEARSALIELQSSIEALSADRENLESEQASLTGGLQALREQSKQARSGVHQLQLALQTAEHQQQNLTDQVGRLSARKKQLMERKQQLAEQLTSAVMPDEMGETPLDDLLQSLSTLEKRMHAAKEALNEVEARLSEHETIRSDMTQRIEWLQEQIESARLNAKEIEVKQQAVIERFQGFGLEVAAVLSEVEESESIDSLEEQVQSLQSRIDKLGNVNLTAIEEYEKQSERKVFLDQQHEDLTGALNTLEQAIKRIDKETRARFKATFDRVNQGFSTLFPRVFGGGSAYLALTGEELLEAGVAIMASPPGKKNSTIHLLSGGEKAMTAIALVFSIFQLNPAPFCLLDEVDAPLDDANVARYAKLVKEMSAHVQFIYITHNKVAMEMADQLMGVTMHEPGVSRVVSVDIDQAVSLVEA